MDFLNFSAHLRKISLLSGGMSLDYRGLHILDTFLSSINLGDLKKDITYSNDKNIHVPKNLNPSENKLSCKICQISDFSTLDEFKLHRQSEEHLNNLTESLSISGESSLEDANSESNSKGSPFFEISHDSSKIQCYKVMISCRKEDMYSKRTLTLDLSIYGRLNVLKKTYIIIAINGGGYFAGAIFDNSTKQIVCSKTFRRYTTRRQQGGSQSLKDNQKSGIHSAGSTIRRENEKRLKEEIINLFISWKSHMDNCALIFCNRDSFLTQEVFKNHSNFLRILPFNTYRANFEEICRCYNELISTIKVLE